MFLVWFVMKFMDNIFFKKEGCSMKHRGKFRFFGFFLSLSLLVAPLPLSAVAESLVGQNVNSEGHAQNLFIHLEKDRSNIADVMLEVSELDEDEESPVTLLVRCIEEGA